MKVNGTLIKRKRIALKISQIELANAICTQPTVSLIERKNQCSNIIFIQCICKRLNLSIDDVIDQPDHNKNIFKYIQKQVWQKTIWMLINVGK